MIETVIRKRIEILTDVALVKRVTDAIDRAGITGWTVTPVTSGNCLLYTSDAADE